MAERSIQETFKDIGLTVMGGEPVAAPSRILIAGNGEVKNRQQAVAKEILLSDEAKSKLDPTGLRLLLSQGVGAKAVIEFPDDGKENVRPYTREDGTPKRAFMTVHPDSDEATSVIRIKMFASGGFWVHPQIDPYRREAVNEQTVDDVIGASVTLGRGGHKTEVSTLNGIKRDTVEPVQPAHTALVLGTSFAESRPLEKINSLPESEAPHYVDTGLKLGGNGFTPELAARGQGDPTALSDFPETIWPPIQIEDMERLLATGGTGLNQAERARYNFYTFVEKCHAVVQIEQLDKRAYGEAMSGNLVLPRSTNPDSVVTYQAELFVGLAKKGQVAVDQAVTTMEKRASLTTW